MKPTISPDTRALMAATMMTAAMGDTFRLLDADADAPIYVQASNFAEIADVIAMATDALLAALGYEVKKPGIQPPP